MTKLQKQDKKRSRRARRVRSKLVGTAARPRLSVDRSNQYVFIQAIDDEAGKTIAALSDKAVKAETKTARASAAAAQLAELLKKAGVKAVVFDRGSYRYHGRVKAVADSLREQGIQL